MSLSAAERKQKQRDRARQSGLVKVEVWVGAEHVEAVKEFAASLPPPATPQDPRQLDLVEHIEAQRTSSREPVQSAENRQMGLGF